MSNIFKLTTAGRAALVAAGHDGTAARTVVSVGVTATAFAFDPAMAAIPGEIKRVITISGGVAAADTLHLSVRDDSADAYTVKGFGLYLDNGVLLGTYSQADPIIIKAAPSIMLLAIDARVLDGGVDISTLIFGDTNFFNPPATETRQGVVELATDSEVASGVDDSRAVTSKKIKTLLVGLFNAHASDADPHPQYVRCLASGAALPVVNEGVIWHDDYSSLMIWQVFNQNGANYTGYASVGIGRITKDAQPTARQGQAKVGSANLSKTGQARQLWNWALHVGMVKPLVNWTQGTLFYADNGDGTFRAPDLRAETDRYFDDGRGKDAGRVFGSGQRGSLLVGNENNDMQIHGFQNLIVDREGLGWDPTDLTGYTGQSAYAYNNVAGVAGFYYYGHYGVARSSNAASLGVIQL